MATPRRLVFGEAADLYDRHRPGYPEDLVADLIAESGVAGGGRALEVGAGTGKATVLVARCGIPVLAVEPSVEMAALARRNCQELPGVEVVQVDFELFDPAGERFGLVYCAQAWHWIDRAQRYVKARAALAPGGLLAAFWNRAAWGESPVREALRLAYERCAPELEPGSVMHPANPHPSDEDEDWALEIDAAPGLDGAQQRAYWWEREFTSTGYAGLLATLSEVRLLDADRRERLLEAVTATIDEHGGRLTLAMVTRLCLARAV